MLNRRLFLQSAAVAAAQTVPPKGARPEAPKMTSSVMLWTLKGSFEEKLEIAARAGLQSVELVSEYVDWSDADIARVQKQVRSFRLGIDTLVATPDWISRPVSMLDPAQRANFLADVSRALRFAQKLEVPYLILMSGNTLAGRSRGEQYTSLVESARRAGDLAAKTPVALILEPLNTLVDHKGFFLNTCTEGLKVVKEADHPHVRLLFDLYHEQVEAGNVMRTLAEAAPFVKVFHVADNPGRHDPGTGEMNYPNIYQAIQKTGYTGYVTMEYLPLGDPVESLKKAVSGFRASTSS